MGGAAEKAGGVEGNGGGGRVGPTKGAFSAAAVK